MIFANKSLSEIREKHPNIHWCIFGNYVYDISEFVHPGGQYIMQKIYGREVGRFMYGSYHLEEFGTLPAYTHSHEAFAILESFKFGKIIDSKFTIVKSNKKKLFHRDFKLLTDPQNTGTTNVR